MIGGAWGGMRAWICCLWRGFVGGEGFAAGNAYIEAFLNGEKWWEGMHGVVGGSEDGVVVVKTMGETHIGPIVDFMMRGGKGDGCVSQKAVEEWYLERLER